MTAPNRRFAAKSLNAMIFLVLVQEGQPTGVAHQTAVAAGISFADLLITNALFDTFAFDGIELMRWTRFLRS
jgi:hypothetical protein